MTDLVEIERRDRVAVLHLNRPERLNAFDDDLTAALEAAVVEVRNDDKLLVIVVAGRGKAFSAGADIAAMNALAGPDEFGQFLRRLTDSFNLLARLSKPSIAAVHGVAYGGGCELALACDLRVVDARARIGLPEITLGILPGAAGTARIARLLPAGLAKQLLFSGDPINAETAQRLGLANVVAPAGTALETACELAAHLATRPPLALAAAKRLVDDGVTMPFDAAVTFERETVSKLFATQDRVEGFGSFLEKRTPTFRGR
jgi:enoyl-CoA hydratase